MKVLQKQYEIACNKYAELFNLNDKWDFFCIAKDSWLAGYKYAKKSVLSDDLRDNAISEVEIGSQQIGMNDKYNNRDKEQLLRDVLSLHFGAKDVRVSIDSKGTISFQGTCD